MEEIVTPVLYYPPHVPTWTTLEAARLMASPALSVETAASQLRRFAQQRWIHPAGQRGSGSNAANLFPPAGLLAARVLSSLAADLGLEDRETVGYVARALYGREAGEPRDDLPKGVEPVVAAAVGAAKGEPWTFALTIFRGDQSGRRDIRATCYNPDVWTAQTRPPAPEMLPIWAATAMLGPLLMPLHARMMVDLERRAGQG